MSTANGFHWTQTNKSQDHLGPNFVARTFSFSGTKGRPVDTTLVHHVGRPRTAKAILYIHGYTDYFFQSELAEYIVKLGYRFYAIDLQGYGRSIRPHCTPNWCDSMDQYQQDIDIALATMKEDGVKSVVILAHSTGGLIASSYLAQPDSLQEKADHYGKAFPDITGLILNSPFFALPFSPSLSNRLNGPIHTIVSLLPFLSLKTKKPTTYAQTLHKKFGGEWDYRLDWKPSNGFRLSFHWLREIMRAQRKLANQQVDTPTLLCSSEFSTIGKKSIEEAQQGDNVLDVDSMLEAAQRIFPNLTTKVIPNGFHDLYLSRESARQHYLSVIKKWLSQLNKKE